MRYSALSTLALATAVVANPIASPQAPSTPAPPGCLPNYPGKFQIQVVNATSSAKRSVEKRQDGKLVITLANGILTDAQGRIGNIVANSQFQFDPPPGQAGAIYTSGWSACANGSLAIGGDALFYQCLSGTFYNLYDEKTAAQCYPVYINVIGGGSTAGSQLPDGQVTASAVASAQTDGQVTGGPAAAPATQISDGQVQATTGTAAVSQIPDGQVQATTGTVAVSQISDGQIQATTGTAVVSQISDGQVQASTAVPAPTYSSVAAPVSQISDGQVQAPTSTAAAVSQIPDGQVQNGANATTPYPTGTGSPVTTSPSGTGSPIATYTGAASKMTIASGFMLAVFGLVATL